MIGNRFDITPWDDTETNKFRCEDPAVAYGETSSFKSFLIAYECYADPNDDYSRDIKGAVVPVNSSSIDDVTRFDICVLPNNQDDPAVCFDEVNERFLVVWADSRDGDHNYNIYGKFFDVYGNQIGQEIVVTESIKIQCEPAVTIDPENSRYMVVWEYGDHPENGPFEIWGILLNSGGSPLTSETRFSRIRRDTVDYNYPHVVFCDDRYLVEWHQDDQSAGIQLGTIYGLILDKDGIPKGDIFEIMDGEYQVNDMCSFSNSLFFVSFDDRNDIWGKFVSLDGFVYPGAKKISDDSSYPADWSSINFVDDTLIALWEDTRVGYPFYDDELTDVFLNILSFSDQPPSAPDTCMGAKDGLAHHSIDIQTKGNDLELDDIQYFIDWGDGTGDWTDFIENNASVTASHIWREKGPYFIKCKARDQFFSESDWSEGIEVIISDTNNDLPESPIVIGGPSQVNVGHSHVYCSSSSDPNGDKVQLFFDWGDGSSSGWTEYIDSGEKIKRDHNWEKIGTYQIRVKARDESNAVSYWSDTYTVNCDSEPNKPPGELEFNGPNNAMVRQKVSFTVSAIDPNGNDVYFWFDWGDCDEGCKSVYGPYPSGKNVNITKTWYQPRSYEIEIYATDGYNGESERIKHSMKISLFKNYQFFHLFSGILNFDG